MDPGVVPGPDVESRPKGRPPRLPDGPGWKWARR